MFDNKAYQRKYYLENKEKFLKRRRERYWSNRKKELERGRAWNANNLPKILERNKEWLGKYPLYRVWIDMRQRCLNPNHKCYRYYGGKGIKICDQWLNYHTFENWGISNGYQKGLVIDRINNEGNYTPDNCQWITQSENAKKQNLPRGLKTGRFVVMTGK